MDKKTKHILAITLGIVFVISVIMGVYYVGGVVSPLWALIISEVGFAFIVMPRLVYLYYSLYDSEVPNKFLMFVPLYNCTMVMSKLITNLILVNIALLFVLGLLVYKNSIFGFLDISVYLNLLDYMQYGLFFLSISLFVLIGIGLGRVSLKVNELYKLGFDNSEFKYGFYKFIDLMMSASTFMSVIFFAIPVIRILPTVLLLEKCGELKTAQISFNDYYDYEEEYEDEEYDEEDEEYYEEEDENCYE